MTYTRHGHHISGTERHDERVSIPVARCGGPGICDQCSVDAMQAIQLTGIQSEPVLQALTRDDGDDDYAGPRDETDESALFLPEVLRASEGFTSMPSFTVAVDFNDLLQDHGEADAFRLIGVLKDLLQA